MNKKQNTSMGLRIAQWLPEANFGGMERFALRLHAELEHRGHALRTWYGPGLDLHWATQTVLGHHQSGVFSEKRQAVLNDLRQNPPDILIHHTGHSLRLVPLLRMLLPKTKHIRVFNLGFGRKFDAFHRIVYALTWRCIFFTTISKNNGRRLLPLRPNTSATVRFGIELPSTVMSPVRQQGEPLQLCCLSRVDRGKGQRELLEAFAAAIISEPNLRELLRLRLVGGHSPEDQGYVDDLHRIIQQHRLHDIVELCGHSDNPAEELQRAHLQVYASREELYGFGLLEAYALGRPAVCTPRGSFQELHAPSRGWFLDVDHQPSATETFRTLAHITTQELQSKSMAARRFAERAFSWTKSVDRFERILMTASKKHR